MRPAAKVTLVDILILLHRSEVLVHQYRPLINLFDHRLQLLFTPDIDISLRKVVVHLAPYLDRSPVSIIVLLEHLLVLAPEGGAHAAMAAH